MRLESYIINESKIELVSAFKKLLSTEWNKAEDILKDNVKKFIDMFDGQEEQVLDIINKHFKTNFNNLNQIIKLDIKESVELDEDVKHWWDFVRDQVFPVVSFIPALDAWIEIDKMMRAGSIEGGNMKIAIIYTLIWLTMLSFKYVNDWRKWKRENPEEYNKERAQGKGWVV